MFFILFIIYIDQNLNCLLHHISKLDSEKDKEKIRKWINLSDENGQTALHLAAIYFGVEIIQNLVELGSDVTKLNDKGESVLHIAVAKSNIEVIDFLLDSHMNEMKLMCEIELTNTPLHIAAMHGKYDVVLKLLER